MGKAIQCRDLGMACDFVARGSSEAEVMRQVAEHARGAHQIKHMRPELAAKARAAIHEEAAVSPPPA